MTAVRTPPQVTEIVVHFIKSVFVFSKQAALAHTIVPKKKIQPKKAFKPNCS